MDELEETDDLDEIQPEPAPPATHRLRSFGLIVILLAVAFGAGYIPKALEVRRLRATLKTTALDLRLANLHRQLGLASQEAQRNNYANAATAARGFFDGCRALSQEQAFAEQPRTREAIAGYVAYADDIVPRLINGDPTVREKLGGLYLAMEGVLQRRQ